MVAFANAAWRAVTGYETPTIAASGIPPQPTAMFAQMHPGFERAPLAIQPIDSRKQSLASLITSKGRSSQHKLSIYSVKYDV